MQITEQVLPIRQDITRIIYNLCTQEIRGFTFCPIRNRLLKNNDFGPNDRLVAILGHERIFHKTPSFIQVQNWVNANLEYAIDVHFYLGGWRDKISGILYLDLSTIIVGHAEAMKFAQRNRQRSIFCPAIGDSLPVQLDEDQVA